MAGEEWAEEGAGEVACDGDVDFGGVERDEERCGGVEFEEDFGGDGGEHDEGNPGGFLFEENLRGQECPGGGGERGEAVVAVHVGSEGQGGGAY